MESIKINQSEASTKTLNNFFLKKNESFILKNVYKFLMIFLFLLLIIYQVKIINKLEAINKIINANKNYNNNDLNFKYHLYEREIITEKMIKYAGWIMDNIEAYFINGIIRKFKPKKCLEIGVARGGSSIIILNALKDINDSFLVSLDLNSYNRHSRFYIGENVKKYFPELTNNNKWKLFTGEQPHKFLDKLNFKYDFLF